MGKRRDKFWDYVVENDAGLLCMFCKSEFARSTSVSMVKYHLARCEMGGIRICTEVPDHVREAAELAIDCPNQKLKTMRSSSDDTIASSSRRQSKGVENPVNGVEREATVVQGPGDFVERWRSPVNEEFIQPFARDTIAEGCRNDWEQMIGELMDPGFMDVYAMESLVNEDFIQPFARDTIAEGCGNDGEQMIAELMDPGFGDVYGMESEAVNMNGDFNVDADLIWFKANDEACNHTIASSSRVQNDRVENLVNDLEREGGVQRSAQVAEEWRSSTSVGVGNHRGNVNQALMQPVDMGVSAVGNDAVNWNEDFNVTADWSPAVPNDRLARDRRMSDMVDFQRITTDLLVTQPFEIGRDAISEDGGNYVENMNRPMASQFDGTVMDGDGENDVGATAMASAASTSFSSPSTSRYSFDVFLSFRGADTRKTFTDHLNNALVQAGIHTFVDDDLIRRGNDIGSAIPSAIESSKVAMIVFSEDFASSRWCLDEVSQIMDCTSSRGLVMIPVFYHVDPSDVRKQSGRYGEAFAVHEKKFKPERVQKWRQALERAANIAGMVLGDRHESKFIEDIVKKVVSRVTTPDEPEPSAHQKTSGVALVTANLIGETFQENRQNIWDCLMKADVFTIGIYGMGGVGKTSLAKHINNQLLKTSNPFSFVYWVTVSQDFSIYRLQTLVAEAADIDLLNKGDQSIRAAILCKGLTGKRNCVLILDDLWESFDLNEVGIPVGEHGFKLILTSRSLEVCRQMNSIIIKVVPLSTNEARNLFWETLGSGVALPPEITQVAEGIVKECAGLPLALKTMAGTMKGVDDICEWRNAFDALKESEAVEGDMEDKVFRVLRFSFNRLSPKLQRCFQSCALFPEDHHIERIELIEHLVAEGIIAGRSMKVKRDVGHALLNKLENACLLEGSESYGSKNKYVKMHDLVRDMAVHILRADSKSMVEAGKQLRELPDEENWKEDLVRVSLMHNNIEEIPSGHSPNCPNLSTLLLCHNQDLKSISESFFEKLNGLQILDLSYTDTVELPDSVSRLVNLTSLLLRGCNRIERVPSLAKLTALKKLDLSETGIIVIPDGMELLSNLLSFDLHQTYGMTQFPSGKLSEFSKLQYLDLGMVSKGVKAMDVARLKKLEFVRGRFSDLDDWNNYIQSFESLCTYCFYLAPKGVSGKRMEKKALPRENDVIIEKLENKAQECFVALPKAVHLLRISECHGLKSLHTAFDFSSCHSTQLKRLLIGDCKGMQWLHGNLPESLEELSISDLNNLCSLLSEEGDVAQLQPPFLSIGNDSSINNAIFSNLKSFKIVRCRRMKTLFCLQLLPNLHNLEMLDVSACWDMVEIIGIDLESSVCSSPTPTPVDFALPKLKLLLLSGLRELQSIYTGGGNLICNSLQKIIVLNCEKLKRILISLPFLELNGKISPPSSLQEITVQPRRWWDSVDWGHHSEKDALGPLVKYF